MSAEEDVRAQIEAEFAYQATNGSTRAAMALESALAEYARLEARIGELEEALQVIAETRTSWPPHQASNRAYYGEAAASIARRALVGSQGVEE